MDPMEVDFEWNKEVLEIRTPAEEFLLNFPPHPNEIINWVSWCPNLLPPILDQGRCGFCWALVCAHAISFLSNVYMRPKYETVSGIIVAAQELLNRVSLHYPWCHEIAEIDVEGCYPSDPILGFEFAHNHGLPLEDDLPNVYYRMIVPVHVQEHEYPRINISGFRSLGSWVNPMHRQVIIDAFRETELVACIAITQRFVDFDGEGIFEAFPCEKITGYHAVIVLVLNIEDNYFIIRNTWGSIWAKRGGFAKVKCNQLFNFSRPMGYMKYIENSQQKYPLVL